MATLNNIKKYLDYEFSSGPYTGQDYKAFQTKYINYLKTLCNSKNWELINVNKNHYEFTAFIKSDTKYVYFSISYVRFFKNEWYNHILIRTAEHEKDYRGGFNNYTNLPNLQNAIENLFIRRF